MGDKRRAGRVHRLARDVGEDAQHVGHDARRHEVNAGGGDGAQRGLGLLRMRVST